MAGTGQELKAVIRRDVVAAITDNDTALADGTLGQNPTVGTRVSFQAGAFASQRFVLDNSTIVGAYVQSVTVVIDTTLGIDGTNTNTFALVYNNGAGGADTTVGTVSNGTVAFTAKVGRAMTLTAANLAIPAGSQVELVRTMAGTPAAIGVVSVIVKAVLN